jgi:type III secretion protein U
VSDKTEPPTPKRLREAREKGQVAKSRDLVSALLFIVIFAILIGTSDTYVRSLGSLMMLPGDLYTLPFIVAVRELGVAAINVTFALMLPMLGAVILTGIAGNVAQTGFLLAFKAMKPDLNKLNPGAQLKNMFSVKNLMEFVKSIVKITVLGVILYIIVRADLRDLLYSATSCGLGCVVVIGSKMLTQVAIYAGMVFVIVAAADYFLQYQQHIKGLRMSKDEVKREYKEMEGDPLIKGKRKQFHHEIMMEDTRQRVRKSSVLVTNPTEIAIAILYDEETPLPMIIAKGEGFLAQRMIAIAKEEGIPIMQNIPLARSLHAEAPVDQYIPTSLIEPVAEVLRWLQTLQRS